MTKPIITLIPVWALIILLLSACHKGDHSATVSPTDSTHMTQPDIALPEAVLLSTVRYYGATKVDFGCEGADTVILQRYAGDSIVLETRDFGDCYRHKTWILAHGDTISRGGYSGKIYLLLERQPDSLYLNGWAYFGGSPLNSTEFRFNGRRE